MPSATITKRKPLNMGDIFVVDNGDTFGITVKHKEKLSFAEILERWDEESQKDFSYEDCETSTFFNAIGTQALRDWLK